MADKPPVRLTTIRNIGIIAHIDAGKTTTTEHVLYYAGAKHKLGEVDAGTTDTDYDPEEQDRGITIYSACIPLAWRECTINLIDTPGHVDFTAEVERSLRVLDGCIVVFDAQKGVEAQSETVWRQADKYAVPRIVFINKMDVVGANFASAFAEIGDRLQGRPVAVTIPIGSGSIKDSPSPFEGIIDLVEMKALYFDPRDLGKTIHRKPIPAALEAEAQAWREKLFDVLTEKDEQDQLTSSYLEGREVSAESIRRVLRTMTLRREVQPVFCGSGREHIGVQPLMDAICSYLPSPLDRPPVVGSHPGKPEKALTRQPDAREPFCALVFKIVADTHGELFYLRIYSGTAKANSRIFNPGRECKEFLTKLYHVHADPSHKDALDQACAGDIVAATGPKESITGDTLCDAQHPILLETIEFAEAVVSRSIEPESSADKQKLLDTLTLFRREDPTFVWRMDPDSGQTLMSGMGMLHLEVKQHRLERDFRLKVRVGRPHVSYRESLRRPVRMEGECVRQAGTAKLFAKLAVELAPHDGAQQVMVENRLGGEILPPLYLAAAERGIRAALQSGEVGYPVIHVRAVIVGAEVDEEASNEIAFEAAGANAVNQALKDNIVLLEPVMHLEVAVPEESLGAVTADLSARRAGIREVITRGKWRIIEALLPLRLTFDYSERVRSLTQGRASWTMEPHAYAPAPDEVLHALLHPEDSF